MKDWQILLTSRFMMGSQIDVNPLSQSQIPSLLSLPKRVLPQILELLRGHAKCINANKE